MNVFSFILFFTKNFILDNFELEKLHFNKLKRFYFLD